MQMNGAILESSTVLGEGRGARGLHDSKMGMYWRYPRFAGCHPMLFGERYVTQQRNGRVFAKSAFWPLRAWRDRSSRVGERVQPFCAVSSSGPWALPTFARRGFFVERSAGLVVHNEAATHVAANSARVCVCLCLPQSSRRLLQHIPPPLWQHAAVHVLHFSHLTEGW